MSQLITYDSQYTGCSEPVFTVSYNNNETWNQFEQFCITRWLYEYYHKSEEFRDRMDTMYNQINVIKPTHESTNTADTLPHFNITLFNQFNSSEKRNATRPSGVIHCYTDFNCIKIMTEHLRF